MSLPLISCKRVNYNDEADASQMMRLLNIYAQDPMGGGKPLADHVLRDLPSSLAKRLHAFSILISVDNEPAALANCFEGFSTFACAPLINVHDIIVRGEYRGMGLSQKLLDEVSQIAKDRGCCKITLEVLSNNVPAKQAYLKYGFAPYGLDPKAGEAHFWEKKLS